MTGIKEVGFFRELEHGDPDGPSIREAVGLGDAELCDQVAGYLAAGSTVATTGSRVNDVLKAEAVDAGALAVQTDGRWIWPADLSYYVREYNVRLPDDFVEWAGSARWIPPTLTKDDLLQVERKMRPEASPDQ